MLLMLLLDLPIKTWWLQVNTSKVVNEALADSFRISRPTGIRLPFHATHPAGLHLGIIMENHRIVNELPSEHERRLFILGAGPDQ